MSLSDPPGNDIPAGDNSSGDQLRDAALARLRRYRRAIVRQCQRAFLGRLLEAGPSTSDVIYESLPLPPTVDGRVIGAAVRGLAAGHKLICPVGREKSRRPTSHARSLDVWTIADDEAARRWLAAHPELPEGDSL